MHAQQSTIMLGKYAIYLRSLSDARTPPVRRSLLGRDRWSGLDARYELPFAKHRKQVNGATSQQAAEEPKSAIEKLEGVVEKSQNILIKANAVFPFDLFPDSITVDRQKLTLVHRNFFVVKQTVSVQYGDIKNIQADIGPLFASLTITSEHFINNTQTIRFLPKKEALAIQQLVQGIIIANKEGIDCSEIDDQRMVELLNQLGRGEAGEQVVPPPQ